MYPNTDLINPISPPLMTSDGLKAPNINIEANTKYRIQDKDQGSKNLPQSN